MNTLAPRTRHLCALLAFAALLSGIVGAQPPGRQDITSLGTPIALITAPVGSGSKTLDVIKDGVFPPVGSADSTRQYDTYTGDTTRTFDWIGYSFAGPFTFVGLTFQEGKQFGNGGWLAAVQVQVRSGGVWSDVSQLSIAPTYIGTNGVNYETFELTFAPATGDAIRLAGPPGGSARFFSVGELRAWSSDAVALPASVTVQKPNGGEIWSVGLSHPITWTATTTSRVDLFYQTSPTGPWLPIAQNLPAYPGRYDWRLPNAPTTQGRVRVVDADHSAVFDASDLPFTITPTVKIMPLGDSITDGVGMESRGGYRIEFWRLATLEGLSTDFVGSLMNGPASLPDKDHEGHSGWEISLLWENVGNWLTTFKPEVVLLMIGTNDVFRQTDLARAPERYAMLLDRIATVAPETFVVAALITPSRDPLVDQRVVAFNNAIRPLILQRQSAGLPISLVDMHPALTNADLADDVHPNESGYNKMAAVWFDELRRLRSGNRLPTVAITAPVPNAVFQAPTNIDITATATDPDGSIHDVAFFGDSILIGTATAPPYQVTWNSVAAGPHTLTARATDDLGATAVSMPVAVVVNGPPTVTLIASDANATEAGTATPADPGEFTISRTGSTGSALTVGLMIGGVAINGTDYTTIGSSVTIPVGATSVPVAVVPSTDAVTEGSEGVSLTLLPSASYVAGSPSTATVTISDPPAAPPPGRQDITSAGTPIALITAPTGGGSKNLAITKDGVFPPVGDNNSATQYDTYTGDSTRTFDWIGSQFATTRTFGGLTFQEGKQFSNGGWLDTLQVQVRIGGVWTAVTQLVSTPAYPGANGVNYETFELTFAPISGDAIRVAGVPGGSTRFFSMGELRVWTSGAAPAPLVLTAPNGGETWTSGTTQAITWTATGVTAVHLSYQIGGGPWTAIAQNVAATPASYAWTIPGVTGAARVRIVNAQNAAILDDSDNDFTITAPSSGRQDITSAGTPIALITAPTGGGSKNLAITKDGVFPPVGDNNNTTQYDTYTGDATRTFDWIGSQFATARTFGGLTFQEGKQFSNGGWLDTLQVQVRIGGVWTAVTQLVSTPAYPGANGVNYETFELTFAPISGDAIRVAGVPGGSTRFFSMGELRVWTSGAAPAPLVLTAPNGGETWTSGTTQAITWTATGVTAVHLSYQIGGGPWTAIAQNVAATPASYAWTIPGVTGTARVRIVNAQNAAILDDSDNDFTITAPSSGRQDITSAGTPIALITAPGGSGSMSLGIIKDGVFPPVGNGNSATQYDTYTGDTTRMFDWIGFQFATTRTFGGLTFQEGKQFGNGGWLDTLQVQVRIGGVWTAVTQLVSTPAYPGANGVNYETFELTFAPISGDAIRVAGVPGGSTRFFSVGELRAWTP